MALFTVDELAVYVQRDLRRSTAELVADLVEDAILGHPELGSRVTDPPQRGLKGLGLEVARRAMRASDVQSESANGTAVTMFPSAGARGVDLTDREVDKLRAIVGGSTAYTVDLVDDGLGTYGMPGPATPAGVDGWGWRS